MIINTTINIILILAIIIYMIILAGEAMRHACGPSMGTRCAGGNEENSSGHMVVNIIVLWCLSCPRQHGRVVCDDARENFSEVVDDAKRNGEMGAEKRQAFTKALLHIKMCQPEIVPKSKYIFNM